MTDGAHVNGYDLRSREALMGTSSWGRMLDTWGEFTRWSRRYWWAYALLLVAEAVLQNKLATLGDWVVDQLTASGIWADVVRGTVGPVGILALFIAGLLAYSYWDTRPGRSNHRAAEPLSQYRTALDTAVTWLYRRVNWEGLSHDGRNSEPAPAAYGRDAYRRLNVSGEYEPPAMVMPEAGFSGSQESQLARQLQAARQEVLALREERDRFAQQVTASGNRFAADQSTIAKLEKEVGAAARAQDARRSAEVGALESQLRSVRGQLEETQAQVRVLQEELSAEKDGTSTTEMSLKGLTRHLEKMATSVGALTPEGIRFAFSAITDADGPSALAHVRDRLVVVTGYAFYGRDDDRTFELTIPGVNNLVVELNFLRQVTVITRGTLVAAAGDFADYDGERLKLAACVLLGIEGPCTSGNE
jgi:hypothetical protein